MAKLYGNYINGEWLKPANASPNINPSDVTDTIGEFAGGTSDDVDVAVRAAKAAFPRWSRSVPYERHAVLHRISCALFAGAKEIGEVLSREEGKILSEGVAEVTRAAQVFEFFAAETIRLAGETIPSVRPGVGVEITREPVGVVGMITPWNFPIAIPAWKIAPALA